jgi:predicted hydrocarbon binding protein
MIMTEGGFGAVAEIDLRSSPIRFAIRNTPEPRRLGYTGRCSCYLLTGIVAGYVGVLAGSDASVQETTCASRGDDRCTFEITLQS